MTSSAWRAVVLIIFRSCESFSRAVCGAAAMYSSTSLGIFDLDIGLGFEKNALKQFARCSRLKGPASAVSKSVASRASVGTDKGDTLRLQHKGLRHRQLRLLPSLVGRSDRLGRCIRAMPTTRLWRS